MENCMVLILRLEWGQITTTEYLELKTELLPTCIKLLSFNYFKKQSKTKPIDSVREIVNFPVLALKVH